jgi:hypothetical protein
MSCGAMATGCTLAQPTAATLANAIRLNRMGRWNFWMILFFEVCMFPTSLKIYKIYGRLISIIEIGHALAGMRAQSSLLACR